MHGDEVRAALTAAAHTWSHCRKHRSGYGWPGCWRAGPAVCVWIGAIVPRAATAAVGPPPPFQYRASYTSVSDILSPFSPMRPLPAIRPDLFSGPTGP